VNLIERLNWTLGALSYLDDANALLTVRCYLGRRRTSENTGLVVCSEISRWLRYSVCTTVLELKCRHHSDFDGF
jgi:hypothetical protein